MGVGGGRVVASGWDRLEKGLSPIQWREKEGSRDNCLALEKFG